MTSTTIAAPASLSASSQTSRFHVTSASSSSSGDIDISAVQLSIGDHHLLEDAHLQLFRGVHYGLVGRNGVGKSVLLKSLAHRWLPGVPDDMSIFYVDQLENDGQLDISLVDAVVSTNDIACNTWRRMDALNSAVDKGDELGMREALLQFEKEECRDQLILAKSAVARTSGARGAEARKRQVALEKRLDALSLSDQDLDSVAGTIHGHLRRLLEQAEDRDELRRRATEILAGFGLQATTKVGQLSGGWRIRVALAMAVFVEPDVLLLDEPTNHLDIPGILWLKSYIQSLAGDITVVLVSHDRAFLNETVDEIILMQGRTLTTFAGNYDTFIETREQQKEHRHKTREAISRKREKAQDSIRKDKVRAVRKGDSKKMANVASRQKKLDDRIGVERNAKGHRFKLNRDRVGYFFAKRGDVETEHVDKKIVWKIPASKPLRTPGPILTLEHVSFKYDNADEEAAGGRADDDNWVIDDVNLVIDPGIRIAIVGANGEGKSTLMNVMMEKLEPSKGQVRPHPQAHLSYFEQHFVDSVRALDESPFAYIRSRFAAMSPQNVFNALGCFDLAEVAQQPLSSLSGGQVVRFAFVLMGLNGPDALFLDEPTNHLDLDASEALVECLNVYSGSVVLVSHDIYFINAMQCSHVYDVRNARLTDIGSVEHYKVPAKYRYRPPPTA